MLSIWRMQRVLIIRNCATRWFIEDFVSLWGEISSQRQGTLWSIFINSLFGHRFFACCWWPPKRKSFRHLACQAWLSRTTPRDFSLWLKIWGSTSCLSKNVSGVEPCGNSTAQAMIIVRQHSASLSVVALTCSDACDPLHGSVSAPWSIWAIIHCWYSASSSWFRYRGAVKNHGCWKSGPRGDIVRK